MEFVNRGPNALCILPTYRCTAACANCCFGSHPWVEGRIDQETILRCIRETAAIGTVHLVAFSGGECFLLGDDLIEAIALANRLGFATRCVSNGYWATSLPVAMRFLSKFAAAGLSEINFSTGDNHAAFVPIDNIINGAIAASRLGVGLAIMVELCAERKVTRADILSNPRFLAHFGESPKNISVFESPWIPMDEGAPDVSYDQEFLTTKKNVSSKRGCESILQTIVLTPQKVIKACCGITSDQIPELQLGNLETSSVGALFAPAYEDFLKVWIAVDGPERILEWCARHDPEIEWENRFAHQCHACQFLYSDGRVRDVLRKYYETMVADVLLRFTLLRSRPSLARA